MYIYTIVFFNGMPRSFDSFPCISFGRPEVVNDGGGGADGGFEGDEEVGGNGRVGGEAIGEELEDGEDGDNGESGESGESGENGAKTRLCCLIACTLLVFKMARSSATMIAKSLRIPIIVPAAVILVLFWRRTRRWLERLLELR